MHDNTWLLKIHISQWREKVITIGAEEIAECRNVQGHYFLILQRTRSCVRQLFGRDIVAYKPVFAISVGQQTSYGGGRISC
jgi:hypothetical protein